MHGSQLFIDDPCVSAKHLRIYTVVYDSNDASEVDTLVYAEDLSRNGTYWNGSLIGRGNGGFLLSTDDVLKLSSSVTLKFKSNRKETTDTACFDEVQEREMQVRDQHGPLRVRR
jgi:pSer/pThr/pTyr-binding forkhead associated (FHA) protein